MNKETLFTTINSEAVFSLSQNEVVNPSIHMGSARIFAIDTVANNVKFSQESTINALPTLKNIPIVALYKDDENNFGDHEVVSDIDGIRYGTYPIGMIPESAEQWIEEVHTQDGVKQYLCSDILLWKRQKKEFQLIKSQGTFSVSMEVGMVDYEFSSDRVCNVNSFYFTAIAVLGNGVQPAFKDACINFTKVGVFQDMMLDIKEYMQQFEGGNSMGATQGTEPTTKDFENGQDDTQQVDNQQVDNQTDEGTSQVADNGAEPSNEGEAQPTNDADNTDYKSLLEKAEAEYGRTIANLTKERDELNTQLSSYEEDKKAMAEAHQAELEAIKQELDALKQYKHEIESEQRRNAREAIVNQMAHDFPELSESEDYKKLLENDELSAEDLENKAYAIIGKLEREKRGSKRKPQTAQPNRIPLTSPTTSNKDKKTNSPYGGLLIK